MEKNWSLIINDQTSILEKFLWYSITTKNRYIGSKYYMERRVASALHHTSTAPGVLQLSPGPTARRPAAATRCSRRLSRWPPMKRTASPISDRRVAVGNFSPISDRRVAWQLTPSGKVVLQWKQKTFIRIQYNFNFRDQLCVFRPQPFQCPENRRTTVLICARFLEKASAICRIELTARVDEFFTSVESRKWIISGDIWFSYA